MTILVLIAVQWIMWSVLMRIHQEWKFKRGCVLFHAERLCDLTDMYNIEKSQCHISACWELVYSIQSRTDSLRHAMQQMAQ